MDLQRTRLIRASAGSGKTFELSNQFLAILLAGELPERILATTFTKKAAGEIKERIFTRLAQAALCPEAAAALVAHLPGIQVSQSEIIDALERLLNSQHKLSICTLDSFFSVLAQNFAMEIGLAPRWRLQDPKEERVQKERVIDSLLDELDTSVLQTLLKFLFRGDAKALVRSSFIYRLVSSYFIFRDSSAEAWDWVQVRHKKNEQELQRLYQTLLQVEVPKTKAGKPSKAFEKSLNALQNIIQASDWRALLDQTLVKKVLKEEDSFSRVMITDSVRNIIDPLAEHAASVCIEEVHNELQSLYHFLAALDEKRISAARQSNLLNFSDVKFFLLRAGIQNQIDSMYYRLDTQFRHVLLDEFQDTAMIEWKLIEPLVHEVLSKDASDWRSFFCVGDVKQAIYGWRGGVAEIFDNLEQQFDQLQPEERNTSFRCSQVVLDFVNKVFSSLLKLDQLREYADVVQQWSRRFQVHTANDTQKPGYVGIHARADLRGLSEVEYEEQSLEFAKQLKQVADDYPVNMSIGVLLRNNSSIPEIVFNLKQLGLDASGSQSARLVESPFVQFVLSCLRLLEHPTDTNVWEHIVRVPYGKLLGFSSTLSDQEKFQLVAELRDYFFEFGLASYVQKIFRSSLELCTDYDVEAVRYLTHEIHTVPDLSNSRVNEVIGYINRMELTNDSQARISVMSIHKSKGLEFDVVIIPDLNSEIVAFRREYLFAVREDYNKPVSKVLPRVKEILRVYDPELQAVYDRYAETRLSEELSVLYVALTRAKTALHIFVPEQQEEVKTERFTLGTLILNAMDLKSSKAGTVIYELGNHDNCVIVPVAPDDDLVAKTSVRTLEFDWDLYQAPAKDLEVLGELMPETRVKALKHGNRIHALLENLDWLDEADLDPMLESYITSPEVKNIFVKDRYQEQELELLREARFAVSEGSGYSISQCDRVVLCKEAGQIVRAEVIDFKSDSLKFGESKVKSEYYRDQMFRYRDLVAKITGLANEQIALTLVFLTSQEIVSMME